MSETEPALVRPRRFHFDWLLPVLFRPAAALERVAGAPGDTWLTPILVLMAAGLARVWAAGVARLANPGPVSLPDAFQYWSPEQQQQFIEAQAAAQGPVFIYVFPGVFALLEIWLGWLILTDALHLVLTLLGGRGSTRTSLNLAAWASLPFAVRGLLQAVFMASTRTLIQQPGLSGFAPAGGTGALYVAALLEAVDIYLVWHAWLLINSARAGGTLAGGKAAAGALLTLLGLRLLQATPALLLARFGGLNLALPFFGF